MTLLPHTSLPELATTLSDPLSISAKEDGSSSSINIKKTVATEAIVEVETDSVLPQPTSTEHIRRRPELRQKPHEDYELSVLPPVLEGTKGLPWRAGDVEIESGLPTPAPPSLRGEDDVTSTSPVLSPEEKSRQVWKGRLHFAACCYCFFLEGWNDGSTGPLLPTIQRYYGVRML